MPAHARARPLTGPARPHSCDTVTMRPALPLLLLLAGCSDDVALTTDTTDPPVTTTTTTASTTSDLPTSTTEPTPTTAPSTATSTTDTPDPTTGETTTIPDPVCPPIQPCDTCTCSDTGWSCDCPPLQPEAGFIDLESIDFLVGAGAKAQARTSSPARLFYSFRPADPGVDGPLFLLFNGGPGASTGTLMAFGTGPVHLDPDPVANPGRWTALGDLLYVVHTGKGFRVFDTTALLQVATDVDSIGYDPKARVYRGGLYKYVLPQIGAYVTKSACKPLYSSVALDRSSDPPSLVSSEYCNGSDACAEAYSGRIYRWSLDPDSGRLAGADLWPSEAHYMAQSHVQGGLARDGDFYLSSSRPAGAAGELYVLPGGGKSSTHPWVDTPEDLMRDGDLLWSLSEGTGERVVFAVPFAKL